MWSFLVGKLKLSDTPLSSSSLVGDVNPFRPDSAQIEAANDQPIFFERTWNQSRVSLYEEYSANCTSLECMESASDRSLAEATGEAHCGVNIGASAWFWFVAMTTIGTL